jgi:hypothetical protein
MIKKMYFCKNAIWEYKNAEFNSDVESIEEVEKIPYKKVINKNMTELCTFSLLLMFVNCLPITICVNFYETCACTPQPGWAGFSIMMECTPESGHCSLVYIISLVYQPLLLHIVF